MDNLIRFFDLIYGAQEGYVCIATAPIDNPRSGFRQFFFDWPDHQEQMVQYIEKTYPTKNMWFCVNLLDKPERKKIHCLPSQIIWADLDEAPYDKIEIPPPIVIESSPSRYQAIWVLTEQIDPLIAEDYSKRVAYRYGADHSGWDLGQLLRIPNTINFKYNEQPFVKLLHCLDVQADPILFEIIPPLWDLSVEKSLESSIPKEVPLVENVLIKYHGKLSQTAFPNIFDSEPAPNDDWSRILWKLINICIEAGMTEAEVLAVANESRCNKYRRDGRPIKYLWRDILKATAFHKHVNFLRKGGEFLDLKIPDIVLQDTSETFVDQYKSWATDATDAVPHFHELSAFILLSALCSTSLVLRASYGDIIPNLWGLILGDSTLSRKTTAMRMATDFIAELDADIVLATDGSAEGLLTGLSERPNRTSMFFKDEITGLFDSFNKKDYLAGMPETLTALYDVPRFFRRRLRKEDIEIKNPRFIFFGGGIREKVYSSLTEEYVLSGFLPRFLVVAGETNISEIRATGPANPIGSTKRKRILDRLAQLYETYSAYVNIIVLKQNLKAPPLIEATVSDKGWNLYAEIERKMVVAANDSTHRAVALPTFERLSRSIMKMAMLLAAERQEPIDNTIEVNATDIANAASYIQHWGKYSIELILSAGNTTTERIIQKTLKLIERDPGLGRSALMQRMKFTKRDCDLVIQTLEERAQIRADRVGKGYSYWPA